MSTPMSAPYEGARSQGGDFEYFDYDDSRGQGLVTFAGVLLMIAGVLNVIYGIAAIDNAHFFVANAKFVISELATWGWFILAFGVFQVFAALAIWQGASWGRWVGVACAFCNAILQMIWISSAPFLALAITTMDVIAIWGLVAYGGRRASYKEQKARAAAN